MISRKELSCRGGWIKRVWEFWNQIMVVICVRGSLGLFRTAFLLSFALSIDGMFYSLKVVWKRVNWIAFTLRTLWTSNNNVWRAKNTWGDDKKRRSKCTFGSDKVKYLGYIITRERVFTYPWKIKDVLDLPILKIIESLLEGTSLFCKFLLNCWEVIVLNGLIIESDLVHLWKINLI